MNLVTFLPQVKQYIQRLSPDILPFWHEDQPFSITPLAQGEYNMNYVIQQENQTPWVLRVNVGSQINRDDQIVYEYDALALLQGSGRTPVPLFVDDSRVNIELGVLGMSYIPGEMMRYEIHVFEAARLFADIHSYTHPLEDTHLIVEQNPLTMTYEECAHLIPTYLESHLADNAISSYLQEVFAWANEARHKESYFISDPWQCIINTEVNSSNFIFNPKANSLHLVDWEKPLWGDPSQDLSHFCVPTTTLWKTEYCMDASTKKSFLTTYSEGLNDRHLKDTIWERVQLRDPFNCLRGISWSAWAWVAYQTGDAAIKNEDTYRKLCAYMDIGFIRGLFEPYMKGNGHAG